MNEEQKAYIKHHIEMMQMELDSQVERLAELEPRVESIKSQIKVLEAKIAKLKEGLEG